MFHVKPLSCQLSLREAMLSHRCNEPKVCFITSAKNDSCSIFYVRQFFFLKRFVLIVFILLYSAACFSQKEKKISLGLSLDYGVGENHNNYASALRLNYNIFEKLRMSPSFVYYYTKNHMKMSSVSFNVHYLFYPEQFAETLSGFKNQGICFYPIAGFIISNFSDNVAGCSSCSSENSNLKPRFLFNFGFNFGAGVDYELPTLLPILKDMIVNFAVEYQILDNYRRPVMSCGLFYCF